MIVSTSRVTIVCVALLIAVPLPAWGSAILGGDDAGAGRDAPNTIAEAMASPLFVEPGIRYQGNLTVIDGDDADIYSFDAREGDVVDVVIAAVSACIKLTKNTVRLAGECSLATTRSFGPQQVTLTSSGRYFIEVSNHRSWEGDEFPQLHPDSYSFSYGLNEKKHASLGPGSETFDEPILPREDIPEPMNRIAPAKEQGPHTVIAVVDTGVNPYHRFFRAPALVNHPSTWIPNFPQEALPLEITLSAPDLDSARESDAAIWEGVARSTSDDVHVYTFPGTRIVAAISFGEILSTTEVFGASRPRTPIFDDDGHGTHSVALAAGANLFHVEADVLIVVVEVGLGNVEEGLGWVARQPWIDAVSLSIGSTGNLPVSFDEAQATRAIAESGKTVFVASGNGYTGMGLPDACPTQFSPYTGPTWVTRIGAAEPESGRPTWWHCWPVDAVARTEIPAPSSESMTAFTEARGTSASAPNAAGHFAHLLLESRRLGYTLSPEQVLAHLLNASEPAPDGISVGTKPSQGETAPLDQGYGLVDEHALDRARATLGGEPRPRPELDTWMAFDRRLRDVLWKEVPYDRPQQIADWIWDYTQDPNSDEFPIGNDAGTGRDAPGSPEEAFEVEPGVVYRGMASYPVDTLDTYAFVASQEGVLKMSLDGLGLCIEVLNAMAEVFNTVCDDNIPECPLPGGAVCYLDEVMNTGTSVELPAGGRYYLRVNQAPWLSTSPYAFSFTLDGTEPPAARFLEGT